MNLPTVCSYCAIAYITFVVYQVHVFNELNSYQTKFKWKGCTSSIPNALQSVEAVEGECQVSAALHTLQVFSDWCTLLPAVGMRSPNRLPQNKEAKHAIHKL